MKVCRNNQLLEAICVKTPLVLPDPHGEVRVVADTGYRALFDEDGNFVRFVSPEDFEKYVVVG